MYSDKIIPFNTLLGKTLSSCESKYQEFGREERDAVVFCTVDGEKYVLTNNEYTVNDIEVDLEDITGDLEDLVGSPLMSVYESSNEEEGWTFYHLQTRKGNVTLRWFGRSNGFYFERADLFLIEEQESI